jgi:undecaprenyl-diphosphatase
VSVPPTPEPGAKRSVRARLAGGPVARRIAKADLRIYRFIRSDLQIPPARRGVTWFTKSGEHAALWYVVGLAGAGVDPQERDRWLRAMAAVFVTQITNTGVKGIFRRPRPELDELPVAGQAAHVAELSQRPLLDVLLRCPRVRRAGPHAGRPGALRRRRAMALSRVYLGVHYPSDIAVGAALGHRDRERGR